MTRDEWINVGSPDLGIESALLGQADYKTPWDCSRGAEAAAINDFLALFSDIPNALSKGIISSDPAVQALPDRQEKFASSDWTHFHTSSFQFPSSVPGTWRLIDAREEILVGRKLGYKEESILFYLVTRFVLGMSGMTIYEDIVGSEITAQMKRMFPALLPYATF